MRLKSFSARSMNEVMASVREDLGDDAIIVSSLNENGMVRVTAAVEHQEPPPPPVNPELAQELSRILDYHGVPEPVAHRLIDRAAPSDDTGSALAGALEASFSYSPIASEIGAKRYLFFGPHGAGKTTTVAKLAARVRLVGGLVGVLSVDNARAAANDQLAALTRVLGTELVTASSRATLNEAIAECPADCPILIDSAGINPFDEGELLDIKDYARAAGAEPVLVMSAGLDPSEAAEIADACRLVEAKRLITTRIDAARRLGSILAAHDGGNLAFCEFGTATAIARGLVPADAEIVAEMLFRDPTPTSADTPTDEILF